MTPPHDASTPCVPDHELLRVIGRGSYGEVWLARNALQQLRAVKVVRDSDPSLASKQGASREFEGLRKFEPISRSHPGLVHILHAGRFDHGFYYVMELADDAESPDSDGTVDRPSASRGHRPEERPLDAYVPRTLRVELRRRKRLPTSECIDIAIQLTHALGFLHAQGLVHRDVKPSNIIFVGGHPKLADIGLVASSDDSISYVGTEGYLPPEGPGKPSADLYALGKVLYESVTGLDRTDFPELPSFLLEDPQRSTLEEINEWILRACDPQAQNRYATAAAMCADLLAIQAGDSIRRRRHLERQFTTVRKAAVALAILVCFASGAWIYERNRTREAMRLRTLAEEYATRLQIQDAENLFARGESSSALSRLARVLRTDPKNRVAAERLVWALTQRNFPRLLTPPLLHSNVVNAAGFSPTSNQIFARIRGDEIHFWDAQSGVPSLPPLQPDGKVASIVMSDHGNRVAFAYTNGSTRLFETATAKPVGAPLLSGSPIQSAALNHSGSRLAVASLDRQVRIFDGDAGRLAQGPLPHDADVMTLKFDRPSTRLATGSSDGSVRLWSVESGQLLHRLPTEGVPTQLQFSPDGHWLATSFQHRSNYLWKVFVWRLDENPPRLQSLEHQFRLYSLAFSPDSRRLAVGTGNNSARVWELTSGKLLFQLPHAALVASVQYSPDGRYLLTASADQSARLWDAEKGGPVSEPMLHRERVTQACFSQDGTRVLSTSWDRTVKVWSPRPLHPAPATASFSEPVVWADWNSDGTQAMTATGRAVFTASRNNAWSNLDAQRVIVWNAASSQPEQTLTLPKRFGIINARFTRQGPRALISEQKFQSLRAQFGDLQFSRQAQVWDVRREAPISAHLPHEHPIHCSDFSEDGALVVTGTTGGYIQVWNAHQGIEQTRPLFHGGEILSVRFDPAGMRVVSASQTGTALVWDARTGHRLTEPLPHHDAVWFAQFSRTGNHLVTASLDNSAKIWTGAGALVAVLPHDSPVEYAEFNSDDTRVVTASGRRARVWETSSGRPLVDPLTHGQLIRTTCFSPDNKRILTASYDGSAQLWDVASGFKLAEPFQEASKVTAAVFSPNSAKILTATYDGQVTFRDLIPTPAPSVDWLPALAESIAGVRQNADGLSESIPWSEHRALEAQLTSKATSDPQARWALRLLTDRSPDTQPPKGDDTRSPKTVSVDASSPRNMPTGIERSNSP